MTHTPLGPRLRQRFGDLDIYLFDQLLKGRLDDRPRVLDAGCGDGRNLHYLLQHGFDCYGIDQDEQAVEGARRRAAQHGQADVTTRFVTGDVARLPWPDRSMDTVLCSAVLHFARDVAHFDAMVAEMGRVLAPNGLLFARVASNIGLESVVGQGGRWVRLPDGSDRFIVDEAMLMRWTERLGGRLGDPLKTTVVQGMRAMTTWCVVKRQA